MQQLQHMHTHVTAARPDILEGGPQPNAQMEHGSLLRPGGPKSSPLPAHQGGEAITEPCAPSLDSSVPTDVGPGPPGSSQALPHSCCSWQLVKCFSLPAHLEKKQEAVRLSGERPMAFMSTAVATTCGCGMCRQQPHNGRQPGLSSWPDHLCLAKVALQPRCLGRIWLQTQSELVSF